MARSPSAVFGSVRLVIGGRAVDTLRHFDVVNPATEGVAGGCPDCDASHVDEAVAAAKAASKTWGATPIEKRKDCLQSALNVLTRFEGELAELICKEQGKPKGGETEERKGLGASSEIMLIKSIMTRSLSLDPQVKIQGQNATHRVEVRRKPVGVVAGITPWNFPLAMSVAKLAPAVVLGNTFVSKPSPFTPLSTLAYVELIKDCFPPGVINSVISDDRSGGFSAGAHLTAHPDVRKVTFTGSERTGMAIMEACARDVKRVTLEMGGNDAAIVRPDVNVKKTAQAVFKGAFVNTGQVCVAIKRAYVHNDIYDEFVDELTRVARKAKFGDGMDPSTEYGPLCNKMQLEKVSAFVDEARKQGATIVTGGQRMPRKGYFYEPTIVRDIKEGVPLVDEEQFGPVLPVLRYHSDEEVLQRANSARFGLGGSVWSSDIEKANSMASQLESGVVWVNEHMGDSMGAPFGGFKHSGLGRERGPSDIESLMEIQTIKVAVSKM